jgi:hypothetical protein
VPYADRFNWTFKCVVWILPRVLIEGKKMRNEGYEIDSGTLIVLLSVAAATIMSCTNDGSTERNEGPRLSVATELGLTEYSGQIVPVEESSDGDETTYTFSAEQGPMCMRGADYRMSVRRTESDDLVIFLQGGGACWTAFCLAVTAAPAGIPGIDLMDPALVENPVRDWNIVYLPYCDGSFFAGDVTVDDDLNGKGVRHHRGLANLTAALEVAKQEFPSPRRILLAGSSGGAYGLLLGAPLVRHYYPDAELIVMADSGIGLARGEEEFLDVILDEFNLRRFVPDDCPECMEGGHLTGIAGYILGRDSAIRMGTYSSWQDSVLAKTFLSIDPREFAESLDSETTKIHERYPDRFRRFITAGTQHTSLLGDATGIIGRDINAVELPEGALQNLLGGDLLIQGLVDTTADGVSMAEWLTGLIDDDPEVWKDLLDEREP